MTDTLAPARSFRYQCEHRRTMHCDQGTGKPTRKRCRSCGGQFLVWRGRWAVFVWRGDGNYRIADALHIARSEAAADKLAEPLDGDKHCVRFVTESLEEGRS